MDTTPRLMGFLTDLEETEAQELQRKLEILNHIMDQEMRGAPGTPRNPQLNLMCECIWGVVHGGGGGRKAIGHKEDGL